MALRAIYFDSTLSLIRTVVFRPPDISRSVLDPPSLFVCYTTRTCAWHLATYSPAKALAAYHSDETSGFDLFPHAFYSVEEALDELIVMLAANMFGSSD